MVAVAWKAIYVPLELAGVADEMIDEMLNKLREANPEHTKFIDTDAEWDEVEAEEVQPE